MAAVGLGFTRYFDHAETGRSNRHGDGAASGTAAAPPASSSYRTVTLNSDRRGHFQVEARIDGRSIDFIVDTGASPIALRESSAAKLGIHPSPRDYTVKMQTANGVGKAARVQLNRVEVNGITVRDVDGLRDPG